LGGRRHAGLYSRSDRRPGPGSREPGDPDAGTPEAALIAKVEAERLRAAIAALPTPFRETLVLREIEGLDYREIAEATEVPIGTVMSRLARAR
jgi:RNA polymerase sigma factor (sigma-70 family)